MSELLMCGICPTLNRPELLGRAIKLFERQTYRNKFLVIIDDAGQYSPQRGDQWVLISLPHRVLSLGEKNNIAAALAPRDVFGYFKNDDDDYYQPWHIEAIAEALTRGSFVQPRRVVDYWNSEWVITETFNRRDPTRFCYHSAWGITRELFTRFGGYRAQYAGDDGEFQERLIHGGVRSADTLPSREPSLWYNRPLAGRISEAGDGEDVYFRMGQGAQFVGKVPEWTDESDLVRTTPTKVIRRPW